MYYIYNGANINKLGSWTAYNTTDFPSKSDVMSADNMLYLVTPKDAANMTLHIDNLDRLDEHGKPLVLVDVANATLTYSESSPIIIGGSVANPNETMQVDWDWVRVRKYAETEPAVTLDAEEKSSSLIPPHTCFSFSSQWGDGATKYYSNNSNQVTTSTPLAPSNLVAYQASPTRIDLTWSDNSGTEETGFEIQDCCPTCASACISPTDPTPVVVAANTTKYSFTALTPGTAHNYHVRAVKSGVSSTCTSGWPTGYSEDAYVDLSNIITLHATAQSSFAVTLDWNNIPADGRGFEIEKKLLNGYFINIATVGNVFSYTDKMGINPLKSYIYRVRKADSSPNSNPYSNEAAVTYTYTPEQGGATINTTPPFTAGDGDCTCTVINGTTVCTPGKTP